MKRIISTAFLFFLTMGLASAFHIIGGEMYYTCAGDNTYDFTMKLYRDCGSSQGAPFDDPANFAVFDENNQLVFQFTAFVSQVIPVTPDLSSPCISFPPDICAQEGTYEFSVEMPTNDQVYTVVYQRCCRNQTIQNLFNPGTQGISIVAEIPALPLDECNSRPFYNGFPPPVMCAQEYLEFDHSATDLDGDSLAYKLCSPFIGGTQPNPMPVPPSNPPYNTVTWGAGFEELDPITADPGFMIDVNTGLLTGVPTQLGQYVIGVCVEEWRNGELLSVNTRDFQVNVAVCENTTEAVIVEPEVEDLCQDLTYQFENLSDPSIEMVWDFGDPTTEDDVSNLYSPSYTYPDTGLYFVTLVTNPGFFCSDTMIIELPMFVETDIQVNLADFECVDGQQIFTFAADGDFDHDNGVVIWDFGPNATPSTGTGISVADITFSNTGPQEIEVEVLNNICTAHDIITVQIPEPPTAEIDPQTEFCNGLNYQFTQESENATIFEWDFGIAGTDDDQSTQPAVSFSYPNGGTYDVSLTVHSFENCPITVTETFEIHPLLAPDFDVPPVTCLDGNLIDFEAGGSYSSDASFLWTFADASPATSTAENPTGITFFDNDFNAVTLEISEHGCTRSANGNMLLHANPFADFTMYPPAGCAPLEVGFVNKSESQSSSISYLWDFGDGNISGSRNAGHTYNRPGNYTVSLTVENLNGCIDSDMYTSETVIEVVPSPNANFKIDPGIVSVVNPVVEITDLSEGNISCTYSFDGQLFEDCNFSHLLENVEAQTIHLTVSNEYGCTAEAEAEVRISDHLIYIPNTFSPNGDGLNDLFIPVTTGAIQIEMHIIDRWGNEVYSNDDVKRGWDGGASDNSDYFAQSEVYTYLIVITDNLGWKFEYQGSVRTIR